MNRLAALALAMLALLAACSDNGAAVEPAPPETLAPRAITPSDFAVQDCGAPGRRAPCAVVRAGGKILLFGAPEGIFDRLESLGVSGVDAVFLTSLRASELDGLIRLRNETWSAGRTARLPLVGPAGTAGFAARLDTALEYSDALTYLERRPAGDYDAALIQPREVRGAAPLRVFDSGDLIVSAQGARGGEVLYTIGYDAHLLQIAPCALADSPAPEGIGLRLNCEGAGKGLAFPGEAVQIILNE